MRFIFVWESLRLSCIKHEVFTHSRTFVRNGFTRFSQKKTDFTADLMNHQSRCFLEIECNFASVTQFSLRHVHSLPADHRAQHPGLQYFRRRNFSEIAIKHNKVSEHSRGKRSLFPFGKLSV